MKIKRIAPALVLFCTLLTSAVAAGKPVTDDFVNDTIRQHLASDAIVKGGAIEVDVKGGVVTLRGKVQEAKQKDKAEKIAKKVAGVKSVVNQITVEKP